MALNLCTTIGQVRNGKTVPFVVLPDGTEITKSSMRSMHTSERAKVLQYCITSYGAMHSHIKVNVSNELPEVQPWLHCCVITSAYSRSAMAVIYIWDTREVVGTVAFAFENGGECKRMHAVPDNMQPLKAGKPAGNGVKVNTDIIKKFNAWVFNGING